MHFAPSGIVVGGSFAGKIIFDGACIYVERANGDRSFLLWPPSTVAEEDSIRAPNKDGQLRRIINNQRVEVFDSPIAPDVKPYSVEYITP